MIGICRPSSDAICVRTKMFCPINSPSFSMTKSSSGTKSGSFRRQCRNVMFKTPGAIDVPERFAHEFLHGALSVGAFAADDERVSVYGMVCGMVHDKLPRFSCCGAGKTRSKTRVKLRQSVGFVFASVVNAVKKEHGGSRSRRPFLRRRQARSREEDPLCRQAARRQGIADKAPSFHDFGTAPASASA